MESMGQVLRERRKVLGLRQEELAELAGVSTSFVRFAEHGKDSIRLDKLVAVLHVLGLELSVTRKTT
jgi:HTH-type transcriptional regulator/antitoxin HipB